MALLQPTQPIAPQNQAQAQAQEPVQVQPAVQQDWTEMQTFQQESNAAQFASQGYVAPNSGAGDVVQQPIQQPVYQAPVQQAPVDVHTGEIYPPAQTYEPVQQHQAPAVQQTQQQVANVRAATGVAQAPDLGLAGFGGLEIGARSFPIIALKTDGLFEDTDGGTYGKGFRCRPISSRPKTAVQGVKQVAGKNDEQVFFTYDGITTTSGRSVAETEQAMIAEGRTLSRREYTDVLVTMDAPEEAYDQELRILSVAPTSRERLSGAMMSLAIRNGWKTEDLAANISSYTLNVEVGPKVTKAVQPFYPWKFSFEK